MTTPPTSNAHSYVAERFRPFGGSIFAEMAALAIKHDAINLGQGFPDFAGAQFAKQAAIAAINAGHDQYARMIGVPPLNVALSTVYSARGFRHTDPDKHITVTCGCSEAIPATLMGMLNPGDEVIFFEPFFDFYVTGAAMAGATPRFVALRPPTSPGESFRFDESELRAAFNSRTRAIMINTPHNPTGKVFTRDELSLIAALCQQWGVVAISDEVYEHLIYNPSLPHLSIATFPGMEDRTITLSSMGKTFSLTGWKVGWAVACEALSAPVRAAHQYLTFSGATPLQHGAAAVLANPGTVVEETRRLYVRNRDVLSEGLTRAGLRVFPSDSTYFVMADHSALGYADDRAFAYHLTQQVGVAAIPPTPFYNCKELGRPLVRFAFCKKAETIDEAVRRLAKLKPANA